MSELTIVLPYKGAEKLWNVWAESERDIDFRRDKFEAERCTACFAALELKKFLTKTDGKFAVGVVECPPAKGRFIELKIEEKDTGGGFRITPSGAGIIIAGHDRHGLLNGAYEFLRIQGWRWVEPGERGECPPQSAEIKWPAREMEIIPSFKYRCLDAYRESNDSLEYLLWMARNRLNVCLRKAASAKFADKLGMYSRKGGHLLQQMLQPDRYLKSGKTIWEEYPEWYGLPADGKRAKESATRIQLCVSQPKLLKYIGDELLKLLNGAMAGVDIIDLWGFDTFGETCSCPACQKTGNGADQNLRMLSALRTRLERAFAGKKLDRKVLMDMCAYEGTITLEGPTKPVPENLAKAGDVCIFYPIKRCYRHDLDDAECEINRLYRDALLSWRGNESGLSIWAGEYYNVSRFEDLPLLFLKRIPHDMRFYHSAGARGATYMHAVFVNWAMRSLTQMQHAQYSWDVNTDDEQFLEDYFRSRYGIYAAEMRKVYALIQEATLDVGAWRNWKFGAVDILRSSWDGNVPKNPLTFGHFKDSAEAIAAVQRSAEMQQQAADIIDNLQHLLQQEQALPKLDYNLPEAEASKIFDKLEYRLGESRRLLVYGIDTMRLLAALMKYHDALYRRDRATADKCWDEVELVAAKMAAYFQPIAFEEPGPGLVSQDALTRTQLRPVIIRCRKVRLSGLLPSGVVISDCIRDLIGRVDSEQLRRDIFHLCHDPLPVRRVTRKLSGHAKSTLDETNDFLEARLRNCGYQPWREAAKSQAYGFDAAKPRSVAYVKPAPDAPWYDTFNVYAEKRGRACPDEIILILAHKDSQSWFDSPGAYDNAVGTAAVLEMARILADFAPKRTIRFLWCDEEHPPMTSITAAANAKARGDNLIAIFNVDAIGGKPQDEIDAGRKPNVTHYVTPEGLSLAKLVAKVNADYGIGLDQRIVQTSLAADETNFIKAGYPAAVLNIGSIPYADPNYHGEGDTADKVDLPNVVMATRAILGAVLCVDLDGAP